MQQSKRHQSKWKKACLQAMQEIEEIDDDASRASTPERTLAFEPMELAQAYVQESTALLAINTPQGQLVSTQEEMNDYVAALNTLIEAERLANNYEQLQHDNIYEGQFFNLAWRKISVDWDDYGPYGQKGRILIDSIDSEQMHVDPKARRVSWDHANFIIQEGEYEIGEIRQMYPVTGFELSDDAGSASLSMMDQDMHSDKITSPISKLGEDVASKTQKIKVYECWCKDSRLRFYPDFETRPTLDEEGGTTYEYRAPALDDEGHVIGSWKPMYPNGRCIVVAEDVILEDFPNRLPHGGCPFIPVQLMPSRRGFILGMATRVAAIARKINDLVGRAHAYLQSEIERPMHAEFGSFSNAQHYKKVPNQSNKILLLNQGKTGTVMRPPPIELPQSFWTMLQAYQQFMDLISGSSAVMRGTLSDGAQVSAEALAALQTYASSRKALEGKQLQSAETETTYQLMWWIRRVYNENIKVEVMMPDGKKRVIDWNSDRAIFESGNEDEIDQLSSEQGYLVQIKAGTGTPNGAQMRQATANQLYDRKAIDRLALLDAYEYPNRVEIAQRMEEAMKGALAAESIGRRLGMTIAKIERANDNLKKEKL